MRNIRGRGKRGHRYTVDSRFILSKLLGYTINCLNFSKDAKHPAVYEHLFAFLRGRKRLDFSNAIGEIAEKEKHSHTSFLDPDSLKDSINYALCNEDCNQEVRNIWNKMLGSVDREYKSLLKAAEKMKDPFKERLADLKTVFRLDDDETEIFLFIYLSVQIRIFYGMLREMDFESNSGPLRDRIMNVVRFTGLSASTVKKAVAQDGVLHRFGIIEKEFEVQRHIIEFLEGINPEPLRSRMFRKFTCEALPLESFSSLSAHAGIIEKLIARRAPDENVNILLYGEAGTGKTEFCRSIGRHAGKDVFEINSIENDNRPSAGSGFRFSAIKACQHSVDPAQSIIVVDEADELLNGASTAFFSFFSMSNRNTEKDIVNEIMDKGRGVHFWICNHFSCIDESTRRRFDYSIEFKKFDFPQRVGMWSNCIAKHGLETVFSKEDVASLAKKYEINAGGIDTALRNFKKLAVVSGEAGIPGDKMAIVDSVVTPHLKLMCIEKGPLGGKSSEPVSYYSLEGLNMRGAESPAEIIRMLDDFSKYKDTGVTAPLQLSDDIRNMNLLLYGPPGTGKTEFVKYLAGCINRKLVTRRGSDFLDMYVGNTEKHIKSAFSEAENQGSILFIDEADGLIHDRNGARRSWEVTQVNEFLAWMEEFRGILICATNFVKNMDSASIRRFNLKIEFDFLADEGKKLFFAKLLQPITGMELAEDELSALHKIQFLTPGDFKVVRQQNIFRRNDKISNMSLLEGLGREVSAKNGIKQKIGF